MSASFVETGTVLDRILARTAADVSVRKARTPIDVLRRRAVDRVAPVSLRDALSGPSISVIAEIKRASPSRGVFPVQVDPEVIADEYLQGGAAALSVLTDEPFFQGSLADLEVVSCVAHGRSNRAPVLRKDFVVDEYQIVEALAFGADAVLLIVAALEQNDLTRLMRVAESVGLDALVEVHTAEEMDRAADAGARLTGINNRDLRTFEVDLGVTERVAPRAPSGTLLIGESGIFTPADVQRLAAVGVLGILVGESLILAPDRIAAVKALIGGPQ